MKTKMKFEKRRNLAHMCTLCESRFWIQVNIRIRIYLFQWKKKGKQIYEKQIHIYKFEQKIALFVYTLSWVKRMNGEENEIVKYFLFVWFFVFVFCIWMTNDQHNIYEKTRLIYQETKWLLCVFVFSSGFLI